MKTILLFLLFLGMVVSFEIRANECPEIKQIECADSIRPAYEFCKKAAESGGSDMIADLSCIKYFNTMKSGCWPCICRLAEIDHIKIKGC